MSICQRCNPSRALFFPSTAVAIANGRLEQRLVGENSIDDSSRKRVDDAELDPAEFQTGIHLEVDLNMNVGLVTSQGEQMTFSGAIVRDSRDVVA